MDQVYDEYSFGHGFGLIQPVARILLKDRAYIERPWKDVVTLSHVAMEDERGHSRAMPTR